MKILQSLDVHGKFGRAQIVLLEGNLMEVGAVKPVDILVVSTFPGDYEPTPTSVVGALNFRGLALSELARNKAVDLGSEYSSWLSQDIRALGSGVNARRILCVEEPDPSRLFRSLVAVLSDAKEPVTVAMPVIGTGDQGLPLEQVFPNILEAAVQWIELGLSIARLEIVIRSKAIAERASALFQRFVASRRTPLAARGVKSPTKIRFDVFVSYSHEDAHSSDVLVAALEARGVKVFQDRRSLAPGVIWQQAIYTSLDECSRIVPLLSPHYVASAMCIEEFNIAMIRRRSERADILAPIYLESTVLPTYMKLAQWIDCREGDDAKLRGAADTLAGGVSSRGFTS